jgi:preprotein translocase subunit YajC
VVTLGGLHGKIATIEENTVTLEVDRGARIKMEKSAISFESSKQYSKDS